LLEVLEDRTLPSTNGIHTIQHVIVIQQENHSFDNYFGTYPGADGLPTDGAGNFTVSNYDPATGQYVKPYHDTSDVSYGGPHLLVASKTSIDGGKMDGFLTAFRNQPPTIWSPGDPVDVMGYYDANQIPNYWAYAQNYVLQDHFFAPQLSYSNPAHLYLVSGWSATSPTPTNPMSFTSSLNPGTSRDGLVFGWTDLTYLLYKNNISWAYYNGGPGPDDPDEDAQPEWWNPLPGFVTVSQDGQGGNVQPASNYFQAAAAGTLPAVSWVEPNGQVSEHPPYLISDGMAWTTSIINAAMQGPEWNSTAIFLTWDEWGGFYDHYVPPSVDVNGYGIRIPGLIISPWAKHGYIDPQTLTSDAYLKFIEDDFLGSQRIDTTDGRPDSRPDVRENASILGDLSNDFDFSQTPAPPLILPVRPDSPTALAGGPYAIGVGQSLSLDASASYDTDGNPLTYAWSVNKDTKFVSATGVQPTLSWAQLQALGVKGAGTYNIQVRETDTGNGWTTDSEQVTLTVLPDLPPVVAISGSASGAEGALYTLNLSAAYSGDKDGDVIKQWNIAWGDGSSTVVQGNPSSVTHQYEAGSYTISATATDTDATYLAQHPVVVAVSDAAITGFPSAFGGLEGQAINAVVATFQDTNPLPESAARYSASVTWGDGSAAVPATVSALGGNQFSLTAAHTYAEDGQYAVTVTVTDQGGAAVTVHETVTVTDVVLQGLGIAAVEGGTFAGPVAAFVVQAGNSDSAGSYSATITWGDGSSSAGTIVANGSGGYTVNGTHSYAEEGSYAVTVALTDQGGPASTATAAAVVADAALALLGGSVSAVEGSAFGGPVAGFRDPGGGGTANDYSATITWGDGHSSAGIVTRNPDGSFTVSGANTYAEDGSYVVTMSVQDLGGAVATVNVTALVADPAVVVAGGFTVSATEGADSGSQVVATFTDPGGAEALSDYSASIGWGDGSTSAGTITFAGGVVTVWGDHSYVEDGPYTLTVTVQHDGAPAASATSAALVADPAVVVTGNFTLTAAEGTDSGSQALATFTDPGSTEALSDYSATVAWGDGSTSVGAITFAGGVFTVWGDHAYAEDGTYSVSVTVQHDGASAVSATSAALVADPTVLMAGGFTVNATEGTDSGSQALATFTDPGGAEALSDYAATVAWGDGSSSAGAITYSGGVFTVWGDHSYASQGNFPITVTIHHDSALDASASSAAAVGAPNALNMVPAAITATEGVDSGSQLVATFTDPAGSADPSAYTATVNWGDNSISAATLTFASGTFGVWGDHLYGEDGSYALTVTVSHSGADSTVVSSATVADPAVVVSGGLTLTATEGADSGSQALATFTDPGGPEVLSDYVATIGWGDGSSSAGTVTYAGGVFTVWGDHAYGQDGTYALTVTVQHDGAPAASATSAALVADPAVVVSGGLTLNSTEGVDPGSQAVATFTDPGGPEDPGSYAATVAWGDGSSSAGAVTFSAGVFTLWGDHAYAEDGVYAVAVTVHHGSAADASAASTALVADPAVVAAGGLTFGATEGADSGSQPVATFTDPGGAEALSDYSATVAWGDGSSAAGTVTYSAGVFTVWGDHAYGQDGAYSLTVTVQHDGAPAASASSTASVSDPAVVISGGLTVSATEGADPGSQALATFTDPGGAETLGNYAAAVVWGDGSSSAGTITFSAGVFTVWGDHGYAEEGTYAVSVTVHHGSAADAAASSMALVADAPLTATGNFTVTATEGADSGSQVLATFTDPGGAEALANYSATVAWGDNSTSPGAITYAGGVFTVTGDHTYADNGSFTVGVTIQEEGGSTATATDTAVVANVPPTAHLSGPTDGVPGQPRTFTLSATDPSPADQAAGFTYTIRWGDGSAVQTITPSAGNGSGVAVDHVFTTPGSYTVQVTATDKDGGTSAAVSGPETIQTAQMQQGGTLAVGGTLGNDTITISPSDTKGNLKVVVNGATVGKFNPTGRLLVYSQAGDDSIKVASTTISGTPAYVTVPAFLFAGDGNDTLGVPGSTANNVLMGGAGKDILSGGLGRDLLVGGRGVSRLTAGSGDDILIGGSTSYDLEAVGMTGDAKLAALTAIMAEWGRTDADYPTRVNHLNGSFGGGLNGSSFLNATTVHGDGAADTLIGSTSASALDWFFVDAQDTTKNKRTGEVVTTVT
jgi:phospholipase C